MIDLRFCDIRDRLPERILRKFCKEAFRDVNLYPKNYDLLISKLARMNKVKKENILLVNGVDEGIDLITRAFGKNVLIFKPTYYEFWAASRRNGSKLEVVDAWDGEAYRPKIDSRIKGKSLIFICNPNMPFGIWRHEEIENICKRTKAIVAVDETYIDFFGKTALPLLKKYQNLLILRSFSKSYSLAGLRIGYIVGNKRVIEKVAEKKLLCNVTSVSVYSALIALEEERYFRALRKRVMERKHEVEKFLEKMGFRIIPSHTNAIVLKFESEKMAGRFARFLKKNEILVTQGDYFATWGLDKSFVRIACGSSEEMKALKMTVRRFRYENSHNRR
ncbi:MAG: hypothetical protein DRP12_02880 [Candidatus Aenigmatarchaeota archaeon]|nr:MAG: hypothetical protein DRP12_02880 [Candidatus Aenigmarchaeota archaeon]